MGDHRHGARSGSLGIALLLLSGCPTVDLGEFPDDVSLCNPPGGIDYFTANIYPTFLKADDTATGCTQDAGCHNQGGGTALNLNIGASRDDVLNFRNSQVFLNCGTPEMSVMLTKPISGIEPHGGGDLYMMSDMEVAVFLAWFD
jgi:hypothetical protein